MNIAQCNPFVRTAEIQPAILEGVGLRIAYDYRFFYILEGSGMFITREQEYPLSPNTLLCLPGGIGYYFRGKLRVVVINFDMTRDYSHLVKPVCPPPAEDYHPEKHFDPTLLDGLDSLVILQGTHELAQLAVAISREFHTRNPLSEPQCSGMLKQLLALVLKQKTQLQDNKTALAEEILSYIALHARTIKSNAELARKFGYHPVYLSTVFEEKTGMTLHKAITDARLSRACRYLIQTEDSIENIALENGFSSRGHFCTLFKKRYGISPLKYRAKERENQRTCL